MAVLHPLMDCESSFDEVHFGGFASNYLRREYFFDVHPPLGKLMIAGVGWLFGYDGGFTFGNIGLSYAASTAPYIGLRLFMVLLSVASVSFCYATMIEMGFSVLASSVTGMLMVFDNALAVQSRFILLDSPLIFFIMASIFGWTKFRQQRTRPFQVAWWTWLSVTGVAIGAATSIKMVGLFTVAMIGLATIADLWELADWRRQLSDRQLYKHVAARAIGLIVVPAAIYLASYWVHFAVLTRTGPGDAFMSADFQTTLEGNQMHEKSRPVYYGHTIRLKSRLEEIYLHSHAHSYPRIHDDGKVSSEGQQVTGYPAADTNNLWKILPAEPMNAAPVSHTLKKSIKSGDRIRLLHTGTNKVLYTHDVASPLTRTNMEVTVVDPADEEKHASTVWIVEIKQGGDILKAHSCQIRLVHAVHKVALTNWQQPLPAWGFGQREVNGDKRGLEETSKWIVWDIIEPADPEEQQALAMKEKPRLSFWRKFIELQSIQIRHNAALVDNHPFKSDPGSWPFVLRGVSYWDKEKKARIYLLGNPLAWYCSILGVIAFTSVAIREAIKYQRGRGNSGALSPSTLSVEPSNHFEHRFWYRSGFLMLGWASHYLPFFTMARTLYLHHYLPAYQISAMVTGAMLDYTLRRRGYPRAAQGVLLSLSVAVAAIYFYFAPITYGTQIGTVALESKKWIRTWDWP